MKKFPIIINNKQVISTDIYNFIRHGKRQEAIDYIIHETNCTEHEATEVVNELNDLIQQNIRATIEKHKQPLYETPTKIIDCTKKYDNNTNINQPKCPTCSSTNIHKISASKKLMGAIGFGLFSKTAKSQFQCYNCGYKW